MNKYLTTLLIIAAGAFVSCSNNHSSCPRAELDIAVDSAGDASVVLHDPRLSDSQKECFKQSTIDCKAGYVYETEVSYVLRSDTTFLFGSPFRIKTWREYSLSDLQTIDTVYCLDELISPSGYFVVVNEFSGLPYQWVAYVTDQADENDLQLFLTRYKEEDYQVFLFSSNWDYVSKIR